MKCLSVRQPWAGMIARGEKTIETRTWSTSYRGPLLIAASKPDGCLVCRCTLTDCRPMTAADEAAACCSIYPGAYAWVLTGITPVDRAAVAGRLRLFEVDYPAAAP
jgi:hypothetical protein